MFSANRILVALFLVCLHCMCYSQGGSGWPKFADIILEQRDYQGNLTITDRHWLQAGIPTYQAIEFPSPSSHPVLGVAYKKGTTITIDVTFVNYRSSEMLGYIKFQGARLSCPTNDPAIEQLLTLSVTPSAPMNVYLLPYSSVTKTITIQNVPNYVAVGQLQLKYEFPLVDMETSQFGDNGTNGTFEGWERLYIVDDTPKGLQSVPWADFLEFSCRWAFGASGKDDVCAKMTRGMFSSNRSPQHRLGYNILQSTIYPWDMEASSQLPNTYYLGQFLHGLEFSPKFDTDCRGLNVGMKLAIAACGHDIRTVYLGVDSVSQNKQFNTTQICPAGLPTSNPANYSSKVFTFHIVAYNPISNKTYDASNAYFVESTGPQIYMDAPIEWQLPTHYHNGTTIYGLLSSLVAPPSPPPTVYLPWQWPTILYFEPLNLNSSEAIGQ